MPFDAGSIVGHVNLETGDFTVNAERLKKSLGGISGGMLKAQIQFALMEKGLRAVTGFLKESVAEYTRHENAVKRTETVLQSTGNAIGMTVKELVGLSDAMMAATTYEHDAVLEAENLLLTFTKVGKDVFPLATETILDMSTALGQDLKSSTIQVGKALQDPILGITALRRVGVNFNASQIELVKNMVKTGRTAEAQAYILKELQTEFGGSARAARDTFAGSLMVLENNLGEVKEMVGGAIVPVLGDMVKAIMPVVEWLRTVDKSTVQLVLGFVGLLAGTYAVAKGIQAVSNMLKVGITPLQGVLMAMAAIGAIATVVNEVMAKARTIHQELAESYMTEYNAIDGQVSRYEELKNKANLTGREKNELIKIEGDLNKKLGEGATYLDDQTGRWRANATAVSQYKKERMELAIKELNAQKIVQQGEVKWAQERAAWFDRGMQEIRGMGKMSTESQLQWVRYGLDVWNIDKARLEALSKLGEAQDKMAEVTGQLTALTTGGAQAWTEYRAETDKALPAVDRVQTAEEELAEAEKKRLEMQEQLSTGLMADREKEIYELNKKVDEFRAAHLEEAQIAEYYNKQIAEINKKYAEQSKTAWETSISAIEDVMKSITGPVEAVWSGVSAVWNQALTNEETAMENEYGRRKAQIEATITDETAKTAALAALDADYDAKKRELQKKQWVLSQTSAIVGAVMNTAQAVTSALMVFPPWLGIALASVVGGLGTAQIALIASQPMPEFARGGMAGPGLALVGERGPEIVNFDRTARVYSNAESQDMLGANSGAGDTNVNFYGDVNTELDVARVMQLAGAAYRAQRKGA